MRKVLHRQIEMFDDLLDTATKKMLSYSSRAMLLVVVVVAFIFQQQQHEEE